MPQATNTALGEIRLAGDLAGNNNALAPALTASGVTAGTYVLPTITVNAKGQITNATSTSAGALASAVPLATKTSLGVASVGAGLSVTAGEISVDPIPDATTTTKGLIQVGDGLEVSSGVLNLKKATTTEFGIVKPGNGLVVSSGVLSVDPSKVATFDGGGTFTAPIATTRVVLTHSANVTADFSLSNLFDLTATSSFTLEAPTNIRYGAVYYVVIRQDAVGGRVVTFDSAFKFAGATPTLSTGANAIDVLVVTAVQAGLLASRLYKNFV